MSALFMLLFLVVPIVELVIFTVVVDAIGLANTVLVILATAVLGASLVRWQGTSVFRRFQEDRMLGRIPAAPIMHGVLILVGGALLLTPGFLTDGVGFSLMVPPVREAVYRVARRLVQRRTILFR